jgi:hypothetical protein
VNEFRVSWLRKNSTTRHRIFVREASALRHVERLIDSDNDPHWKCDEAHQDCMEPLVAPPMIETRTVSEWVEGQPATWRTTLGGQPVEIERLDARLPDGEEAFEG